MNDSTLRRVLAFFLAIFVLIAVAAGYALRTISRSTQSTDWVNHTYATIYEIENAAATLQTGDVRMRMFALNGDPLELAASREAFAAMSEHLDTAKVLVRDDPETSLAMEKLETLANQRATLAAAVWQARLSEQSAQVRELLAADAGSNAMGDIRRSAGQLRDGQFALLNARAQLSYRQAQTTRWVVGIGVGLNLILFAAVAWLIRDDLKARDRLAAGLRDVNNQLEVKVQERTAELHASNAHLITENLERQWANQALDHQLRYNQAIVDSVYDLVFVVTKILYVTRINPAVTHATGFHEENLVGQPLSKIIAPIGRFDDALATVIQALREGRDVRDVPVQLITANNQRTMTRMSFYPLRDRDKVVGGIAIVQPPASLASPAT